MCVLCFRPQKKMTTSQRLAKSFAEMSAGRPVSDPLLVVEETQWPTEWIGLCFNDVWSSVCCCVLPICRVYGRLSISGPPALVWGHSSLLSPPLTKAPGCHPQGRALATPWHGRCVRIACTHTMRGRVDIPYVRTIGPYSTHVRTYIQYVHHSGLCVPIHIYMHVYIRTCVGIRICTCPHTHTRPHSIICPNCKYLHLK